MKEEKEKRHIQLPNNMSKNNLTVNDILVYFCIKSFDNGTSKCYPSLKKISELSSLSIPTIQNCIKSLKASGMITTEIIKRRTYYTFSKYDNFEVFSYDFLHNKDLSAKEKGYLLLTQQHMFKNPKTQTGTISYSERELSKVINMAKTTIHECNKSLESKGIMRIAGTNEIEAKEGDKIFELSKFGQQIVFVLQDHEERLTQAEIERLQMKKELEELKEQIKKLTNKEYVITL